MKNTRLKECKLFSLCSYDCVIKDYMREYLIYNFTLTNFYLESYSPYDERNLGFIDKTYKISSLFQDLAFSFCEKNDEVVKFTITETNSNSFENQIRMKRKYDESNEKVKKFKI